MSTGIEWTDETWNPVRGCTRVSEGCRNCYAEGIAKRFSGPGLAYEGLVRFGATPETSRTAQGWSGDIAFVEERLLDPMRWKRGRRIFVNSMSDLFHDGVTDEQLDRVFAVMALCPQHTFQVLTKRPERMLAYLREESGVRTAKRIRRWVHDGVVFKGLGWLERDNRAFAATTAAMFGPLPNVWLGVSVEDQKAKARIDDLRRTRAAVRFLSLEPLLEDLGELDLSGIDWVICGGESGRGARPMHPAWARSVRDQCAAAGVPFFFKQWGEFAEVPAAFEGFPVGFPAPRMVRAGDVLVAPDGHSGRILAPELNCEVDGLESVGHPMRRVGKKAAGDLLDGVRHHAFPEVRA